MRSADAVADRGSSPVELAAVMAGVLALLALMLAIGMRWLAAQAALAAAQRALEIAQTPDGLATDAAATADRLARSSKVVTEVTTIVRASPGTAGMPTTMTVTVTVTTVLGTTVARSASGPAVSFIPQRSQAQGEAAASAGQRPVLSGRAP